MEVQRRGKIYHNDFVKLQKRPVKYFTGLFLKFISTNDNQYAFSLTRNLLFIKSSAGFFLKNLRYLAEK